MRFQGKDIANAPGDRYYWRLTGDEPQIIQTYKALDGKRVLILSCGTVDYDVVERDVPDTDIFIGPIVMPDIELLPRSVSAPSYPRCPVCNDKPEGCPKNYSGGNAGPACPF